MQRATKHSVTEAHPSRVFKTACDTWYWLLLLCILDAVSGGGVEVQVVCRGRQEGPSLV